MYGLSLSSEFARNIEKELKYTLPRRVSLRQSTPRIDSIELVWANKRLELSRSLLCESQLYTEQRASEKLILYTVPKPKQRIKPKRRWVKRRLAKSKMSYVWFISPVRVSLKLQERTEIYIAREYSTSKLNVFKRWSTTNDPRIDSIGSFAKTTRAREVSFWHD